MGVGVKISIWVLSIFLLTIVGCNSCSDTEGRGTMSENIRGDHAQLNFDYDPPTIDKICQQEIDRVKQSLDKVGATNLSSLTFQNSVVALEQALAYFSGALEPVSFLKYVSSDENVRTAA